MNKIRTDEQVLERWCLTAVLALLAAVPAAGLCTGGLAGILPGLLKILRSPSPVGTDYFAFAGMGATFLNAALSGGLCLALARLLKAPVKPGFTVAFMLVISHCFFGMNLLTLSICAGGVLAGALLRRVSPASCLNAALFAGCLGPFVGELLFRYTQGAAFDPARPRVTAAGLLLALAFSLAAGLLVPNMLAGVKKMHQGYQLYNAGITIGLLGVFLFGLFYKTLGKGAPATLPVESVPTYGLFVNCFYILLFGSALALGWLQNGKSFKGYGAIVRHNGYEADFVREFGTPLCLLNVGIYGFFILGYMNLMALLPGAAGFTGPTSGVILAAMTFVVMGQEPGDVWPIMAGYLALGALHWVTAGTGAFLPATQGYVSSLAFATGLCPIAGRHGWKWGMAAGFICGAICTQIAPLHGGLMLFNGGFGAGITALILVPFLDKK